MLTPGMYLADVGTGKLRHGFTVTRSAEIVLSDLGDPPIDFTSSMTSPALNFQFLIKPDDPTATVRIVGEGFRTVDAAAGQLTSRLPCNLYEMRIQIGRQLVQKVVLLDADWPSLQRR